MSLKITDTAFVIPHEKPGRPAGKTALSAWWTLIVLALLYLVAILDRTVMGLLIPMIKADLALSDFSISLLQGFAFAIFFSLLGLPLGFAVDRYARRPIIFAGIIVWGLATVCSGLSTQYHWLFISRVIMGAGEAVLSPAAYSIISDIFPRRRLGLALSIFGTGATFGNAVALLTGGFLIATFPSHGLTLLGTHLAVWQLVLISAAMPALLLASLIFTTVDPIRTRTAGLAAPTPLAAARFALERVRLFGPLFIGYGCVLLCTYAWLAWAPTYMNRQLGLPLPRIGFILGLLACGAVALGQLIFGSLTDRRFAAGHVAASTEVFTLVVLGLAAFGIAAVTTRSLPVFMICAFGVFMCTGTSAVASAIPLTTPNEYRGQVSAFYLMVANLIGLSLGPSVVAVITDRVFHDPARVGDSLAMTFAIFGPIGALCLWSARRPLERLTRAAHQPIENRA